MKTTDPTTTTQSPTPYIAVAANYFGTGKSAQEARKNLTKAGGSPQEPQTVFKLPDGAVNAYVGDTGEVYWSGVEGEMRPVFRYVNGKAVAWGQGEDQPIPFKRPTADIKPLHSADAQDQGSITPEPELAADSIPDKESTISSTKPKKRPSKKPKADVVEAANSAQAAPQAQPKKRPSKKPAPVVEIDESTQPVVETQPEPETQPVVETQPEQPEPETQPAVVVAAPKKAKVPKVAPVKETAGEAADFLMFVGGSFYSKDVFIKEAEQMGISRRLPSHRLPKGLVCGASKVYLATEGGRKTDGTPDAEVFGYFTPSAVHFMSMGKSKEYADIIGALKLRKDTKIVDTIKGEPERACGFRQEGGTYIVVDKSDTPLKLLDKSAHYVGNHFRGMLRLNDLQARQFNTGGTVATLVDEKCMNCGDAMKCAPDGHARAERERKRIEKGQPAKWLLLDAKCQKALRAQRAADDGPQSADEDQGMPQEASE